MEKVNGSKLDLLRVKSGKVLVGERELTLRTSTIMQQNELAKALGMIDPSPLFQALRPIVEGAGASSFYEVLLSSGAAVWAELVRFLTVAAGTPLAEAAAALLDNQANFTVLRDDEKVVDDADRELEGKRYVRCEVLQAWVRGTITPRQAFHVLVLAVELNDYGILGEALAGLARKAAAAGRKVTTSPTRLTSSAASATVSSGAETASSPTTPPEGGSPEREDGPAEA